MITNDSVIFNRDLLIKLRKAEGYNQGGLTIVLNLSDGHISRLESGKYKNPTASTLYIIAKHFKVQMEDFMIQK